MGKDIKCINSSSSPPVNFSGAPGFCAEWVLFCYLPGPGRASPQAIAAWQS